ncbi:MAG: DUF427 domain-containing protein [Granulosicoccaceae bacterium]
MKAIWKGVTLAESDDIVVVEGNCYFPSSAVNMEYLTPSDTKTTCPWKGVASYYTISVGGDLNEDAAWCYPEPKEGAKNIQGRIAFWRGIQVTE